MHRVESDPELTRVATQAIPFYDDGAGDRRGAAGGSELTTEHAPKTAAQMTDVVPADLDEHSAAVAGRRLRNEESDALVSDIAGGGAAREIRKDPLVAAVSSDLDGIGVVACEGGATKFGLATEFFGKGEYGRCLLSSNSTIFKIALHRSNRIGRRRPEQVKPPNHFIPDAWMLTPQRANIRPRFGCAPGCLGDLQCRHLFEKHAFHRERLGGCPICRSPRCSQ